MRRIRLLSALLLLLLVLAGCGGQGSEEQAAGSCTVSISCATILDNRDQLKAAKADYVPDDGVILPETEVTFYEGESVFDLLQRLCRDNGIPMESSWSPLYKSAYIEGIGQLYEFDCGELSGWMYSVNGAFPNTAARNTRWRMATWCAGSIPATWGKTWAAGTLLENKKNTVRGKRAVFFSCFL